jgi:DNA-binding NarL/FixJ family response regulator
LTARVVVADGSAFVRMAVRSALAPAGIAVVAEAEDAAGALKETLTHRPDAVLLDVELDEDIAIAAALRRESPGTALIILSPDESVTRALAAVCAGAVGFVPKHTAPERLPDIVRGAVAGEAAIPRRIMRGLLERMAGPPAYVAVPCPAGPLRPREWEILDRMARGMTDRHISAELRLSEVTVRRHAAAAARRLGARRREDAVAAFRSMERGS